MKYLTLPAIAVSFIFLYSCRKTEEQQPAPKAQVQITNPTAGKSFRTGDTVHVHGTITYVSKLHGYHVTILDNNKDTVFACNSHVHATELTVDTFWVNTLTTSQDLNVVVSSELDHDGNAASKEIIIKALP